MSNATTSRRLFELVEPLAVVRYVAPEPTEAVMALGAGTTWEAQFAGRATHERATTTLVLIALNHALRARDDRTGAILLPGEGRQTATTIAAQKTQAVLQKNYSGMAPITRASGLRRVVLARPARNRRLVNALYWQAFAALSTSPGARAYYDAQ